MQQPPAEDLAKIAKLSREVLQRFINWNWVEDELGVTVTDTQPPTLLVKGKGYTEKYDATRDCGDVFELERMLIFHGVITGKQSDATQGMPRSKTLAIPIHGMEALYGLLRMEARICTQTECLLEPFTGEPRAAAYALAQRIKAMLEEAGGLNGFEHQLRSIDAACDRIVGNLEAQIKPGGPSL